MKKLFLISGMALGFLLFLVSCSTPTTSHTMEDNTSMSGATHEESVKNESSKEDTTTKIQSGATNIESTGSHAMEDAPTMSGSKEDMHAMDNGTKMEGKTHEEAIKKETTNKNVPTQETTKTVVPVDEESIVWDGKTGTMHAMDDGETMSGTKDEMEMK